MWADVIHSKKKVEILSAAAPLAYFVIRGLYVFFFFTGMCSMTVSQEEKPYFDKVRKINLFQKKIVFVY